MLAAGYTDVPVISCTLADGLNDQPGFDIDWLKLVKILFLGTMYADSLAKMYYATVVREKTKGVSKDLHTHYLNLADGVIRRKDYNGLLQLLEDAITDFNNIEVHSGFFPKIGVVGEIYVKYNSFGHQQIVDWLINQGVEVVVPPIIDFFTQDFINIESNQKAFLKKAKFSNVLVKGLDLYTHRFQTKINKALSRFRFFSPFHNQKDMSKKARRIMELVSQFGEGWLIAAEISAFADEGVNNVVSLQPFGCIANHVISKGVETRIKELYPNMNLLFLDFEAGTSEVNILNRLYFMLKNVNTSQGVA